MPLAAVQAEEEGWHAKRDHQQRKGSPSVAGSPPQKGKLRCGFFPQAPLFGQNSGPAADP